MAVITPAVATAVTAVTTAVVVTAEEAGADLVDLASLV
jgi:hypothetical protein